MMDKCWNCGVEEMSDKLKKGELVELLKICQSTIPLLKMKINKKFLKEFSEQVAEGRRAGDWLLSRKSTTKKYEK